jgi:DNA repair ATPase RecN
MSELSDTVSEAVDKAQEEAESPPVKEGTPSLNSLVAVSVAIVATFIALCNVKDGNIVQAMQQAQANGVDEWAYFQAKGTKLNIAESARDALSLQREMSGASLSPEARALVDKKLADYDAKIRLYEQEKAEIKAKAEGFQQEYDRLNTHDDQFDMAEALTSVAIALLGITALTRKRRLLYVAWTFAALGVVLGIAGFAGLGLHPDFLARWLG